MRAAEKSFRGIKITFTIHHNMDGMLFYSNAQNKSTWLNAVAVPACLNSLIWVQEGTDYSANLQLSSMVSVSPVT